MASIIKVDQIQENTSGVGTNFSNTGSATTPTISIGNQTNKGFYHLATDKIGVSVGGQRVGEIGSGYGGFTGNIIQVINSSNSFQQAHSTNGSFVVINSAISTPWEISITPKYSNSRIFIFYSLSVVISRSSTGSGSYFGLNLERKIGSGNYSQIFEGSRDSNGSFDYGISVGGASSVALYIKAMNFHFDNPNTISTVSYRIGSRTYGSGDSVNINFTSALSTSVSSVVLLEVQT